MKCLRCQHENLPAQKFCGECGARLIAVCPSCRHENPAGQRFCGECGTVLAETASRNPATPEEYTPKHLAQRILSSRAAMEGERKQVTVLFADLKGSMELLADRDPEEARRILDPVLDRMMEAVHRYEGTVNQVMGDGIMALFGAPLAHEEHAVRACYAALRMQSQISHYGDETQHILGVPIQIRIGLNSGEVVVRAIGSDLHMDYTAVGQTTHLAARMEQLASPGSTLMTAATFELAQGRVAVTPRGPTTVKGLSDSVELYQLSGIGATNTRFQASATRGLTRFVGRSAELAQMFAALERAQAGCGELVALVGEPGVGKTRLVWEFIHSQRTRTFRVLETGSVSYGKASAWRPVIDLFKAFFQIREGEDEHTVRDRVAAQSLMQDHQLETFLSPLLYLLDVPVEDTSWDKLEPAERRVRILDACKRLLLREAHVQPLLLVFEDLHWIDHESQVLLDTLVDSLPGIPMLLLVNYRPEYQHRWGGKSSYTQIRVDPLDSKSTDELLDALLGVNPTLKAVRRLLLERTGGNSFFLEESARTLVESGVLEGAPGAYELVRPLEEFVMPATVQAVLAARIDRLAEDNKRVLQTASVIGKDVPFALLRDIAGLPTDDLRAALADLQTAEFVYEASTYPALEYTFKHALTHEVAYRSLLQRQRRALHARIVEAMEGIFADRVFEQVERLAHHAVHAEVWEKAVDYLRQAGSKAFNRSANREAAMHLEQAVSALSHLPQTQESLAQAVDLRATLYSCLIPLGEQVRGLELMRQAEPLVRALGDPRRTAWIHCLMSGSLSNLGYVDEGLAHGEEVAGLADSLNDAALAVTARFHVGIAYRFHGAYRRAFEFFRPDPKVAPEELIESHRSQSNPDMRYRASAAHYYLYSLNNCSHCLTELGELDEASAYSEQAAKVADALELRYPRALVDAVAGHLRLRKGDLAEAVSVLERCIQTYESADARFAILVMVGMLGPAYTLSGRIDDAIALFERTRDFAEARGLVSFKTPVLVHLGDAYSRADRSSEAVEAASCALDLAKGRGLRGYEAWALYALGEIHSRAVPVAARSAIEAYSQGKLLARELQMHPLEAMCTLGRGAMYAKTGERDSAHEDLIAAATSFQTMGMQFWREKAQFGLSEL
jgi:class 3 adenylate cyclase/tetratricopeptide (TPR) repeat protein